MGSPKIRVGQWYSGGVGFEKVVWQCETQGWQCSRRHQTEQVRERKETGKRERETACKERERENGKRKSKVMIWIEERKLRDLNFLGLKMLFSDVSNINSYPNFIGLKYQPWYWWGISEIRDTFSWWSPPAWLATMTTTNAA